MISFFILRLCVCNEVVLALLLQPILHFYPSLRFCPVFVFFFSVHVSFSNFGLVHTLSFSSSSVDLLHDYFLFARCPRDYAVISCELH